MKRLLLSSLVLFCLAHLGYTQTDLSGVVNEYTRVLGIDPCLNSLRVGDIAGFQIGDRVLLIQMQGARIAESDNASFGDILDLGSAGLNEKGTITSLAGDEIILENTLLNDYDIDGRVQLVRIASHSDARITGPIQGRPWDGETGGLIVLEIENTLEMTPSGSIDANEIGFRGGIATSNLPNDCSWISPQNDFFYSLTSWRAAAKGEGIARFIVGKEAGKGPQANGGGGGNDHNSGGGGGAHFSAGGLGGVNEEPSLFGCQGNHPGLGGRAITTDPELRLWLGGGGGAGHGNNNRSTNGGTGGGIILIQAKRLVVNNPGATSTIQANGGTSLESRGDGGGGGGAGGHCLLAIEDFSINGTLQIEAIGGDGAAVNNQNRDRCHGPGGGGAGGEIAISTLLPLPGTLALDQSGGQAGMGRSSNTCPDGPNGAQRGNNGSSASFTQIPESTTPGGDALSIVAQPQPIVACEGDRVTFDLVATGTDLLYQWEYDDGSGFQILNDGAGISGSQSANLVIDPVTLGQDGWVFRGQVSNDCFGSINSQTATLEVLTLPTAQFTSLTAGSTVTFTNTSTGATTYVWDFGDSQVSTDPNPMHTYAMDGVYTVSLTATNSCGMVTFSTMVTINTVIAPVAGFLSDQQEGCVPMTVQFTDQSLNNATAWEWSFPGGTPASSTLQNPSVTYSTAGVFDVILRVSNSAGIDEESQTNWIKVMDLPSAGFSFIDSNGSVQFTNLSSDANSYVWDFGDSQSSTLLSPLHTYSTPGNYTVRLTVTNDCGTDVFEEIITVNILQAPIVRFTLDRSQGCTPMTVQFTDESSNDVTSWLWSFPGGIPSSSTDANPVIRYDNAGLYNVTLRVTNAAGFDEQTLTSVLRVEQTPNSDFSVEQDLQDPFTFNFTDLSQGAQSIAWDFGDGSPFEFDPQVSHTYAQQGTYTVILTASNSFCSALRSTPVGIYLSSTSDPELSTHWQLWPNPSDGWLNMTWDGRVLPQALRILDASGREVYTETLARVPNHQLDLSHLAAGLYLLQWRSEATWMSQKLVIW